MPPVSPERHGLSPLFITGAPRSGTSWLGELLSEHRTRLVYEPFNPQWNPAVLQQTQQFLYLDPAAMEEVPEGIKRSAIAAFEGRQTRKQVLRALYRGYLRRTLIPYRRILVKDPTAVLMSEWLQHQFDATIVVIVRHPCAVISSILTLGWHFGLERLLSQPSLMERHLADYRSLMEACKGDQLRESAAFWSALHIFLGNVSLDNSRWHFVSYESLCTNTEATLAPLASSLGMQPPKLRRQHPGTALPAVDSDPGSTRRNSSVMPSIWQERLSKSDQEEILAVIADFGLRDTAGFPIFTTHAERTSIEA